MKTIQFIGDTGLSHYMDETKRFPMLSAEEECALALAWRDHGDAEALRQLTGSHLRLVIKVARGFGGYGLPIADLVAEGNVGLMQAAQKFDADRGFRFATYAMWWIRAAIQEFILHNWSLVKIGTTAAQKKLFFNLRRLKGQMRELEQGDLSPETVTAIATELEVPEADVINLNRRLAGEDSSLDTMVTADGSASWLEMLADERPTPETAVIDAAESGLRRRLLIAAMAKLNAREREILLARRLKDNPSTLEVLSERFKVSRERIRQIEARAFQKLQKAVLNAFQSLPRARALAPA
ncbi:MAG: RNA polymerase sigma factor RpoH [Azospirillaceae bacterium]|nr:RNA polymerase sigma factor RpoH [Azospirillaceae bacterium]